MFKKEPLRAYFTFKNLLFGRELMGDSKLEEYNRLVGHIPAEIRGR